MANLLLLESAATTQPAPTTTPMAWFAPQLYEPRWIKIVPLILLDLLRQLFLGG